MKFFSAVPGDPGMGITSRKRSLTKTFRVMKFMAIFMLSAVLQVSAKSKAQVVTYTARNETLTRVLAEIERQTQYSVFYRDQDLKNTSKVSVSFDKTDLQTALRILLQGQPLEFRIEENTVFIKKKKNTDLSSRLPSLYSTPPITGIIRDSEGNPLASVNVVIKGTKKGVTTDLLGKFSIEAKDDDILVISSIGFNAKEIKINPTNTALIVVLEKSISQLDEVQYIAYGSTTKRLSTGNISTVKAETIGQQPVSNPLLALQGRVPGLFIEQTSGISAADVKVNIQGVNSLAQGTSPFIVVDGVPFPSNTGFNLMGGAFPSVLNGINTMSYLNPNDIESISILKDADATAIYGSRAANGAILITTKKGKPGKSSININVESGWENIPRQLKMMNTQDYIALRREGKKNDNASIGLFDYDINGLWDTTRNTNWQEELGGGTARYTRAQASLSGGSNQTQFNVSGSYLKETTVYPSDSRDIKISAHTSLSHRSANQKFRIDITSTYLQDDNTLANADIMKQASLLPPNAPPVYSGDGSLNWEKIPGTSFYSFDNPFAYLQRRYKGNTSNLLANAEIGYTIIPGLEIGTTLGYNKLQNTATSIIPQASFMPSISSNFRSNMNLNSTQASWNIEPNLKYHKEFEFGHLDFLFGTTFQQKNNSSLLTSGGGFLSDAQIENIANAPILIVVPDASTYKYNAFYGRLIYNHQNKYILTLAARRDGTTRFGPSNRFVNFYSAAGAWLFSEESFFKRALPFVSQGKLKISYGTSGNDQIQDYLYLSLYNNIIAEIPYQQATGLEPVRHSNPYLQWELTKKLNLGLDLGILNNRIQFSGNFYFNRSSNQLLNYPLGLITGFAGINRNINATIQNTGLEARIDADPINGKKFRWNVSANITIPKNKLVSFPGLEETTYAQSYVVGQPITIAKVYPFLGVNPGTGLYEYQNKDGKSTSSPNSSTDRTAIVNLAPRYYGGLSNSISYKGLTLDFIFQCVKKMQMGNRMTLTGLPGSRVAAPSVLTDRWKMPGDKATYQRAYGQSYEAYLSYSALQFSEAGYEDGSFIKLKNISLSYALPLMWLKKAKINSATIYLHGQNLFTVTNYFGLSPESTSLIFLPPLRTITLGIHLNL